jgi:hypothetical protein
MSLVEHITQQAADPLRLQLFAQQIDGFFNEQRGNRRPANCTFRNFGIQSGQYLVQSLLAPRARPAKPIDGLHH